MQVLTAQIFITAFQTLPVNEQLGVYQWIKDHKKVEKEIKVKNRSKNELYILATESFGEIWNAPKNNHWEEFLKDK